jgi:hypothetical protein
LKNKTGSTNEKQLTSFENTPKNSFFEKWTFWKIKILCVFATIKTC